jgi:hypothetical protein
MFARQVSPVAARGHIGSDSWEGYIIFEFPRARRVVPECPFAPNAIYVLSRQWRQLIAKSKGELREMPAHAVKIVHKSEWLSRVRTALRRRNDQNNL